MRFKFAIFFLLLVRQLIAKEYLFPPSWETTLGEGTQKRFRLQTFVKGTDQK